jgi:hypothetical protein
VYVHWPVFELPPVAQPAPAELQIVGPPPVAPEPIQESQARSETGTLDTSHAKDASMVDGQPASVVASAGDASVPDVRALSVPASGLTAGLRLDPHASTEHAQNQVRASHCAGVVRFIEGSSIYLVGILSASAKRLAGIASPACPMLMMLMRGRARLLEPSMLGCIGYSRGSRPSHA